MLKRLSLFTAVAILATAGCGDDDEGCGEDEVEVNFHQGEKDGRSDCSPIPAECGGAATCDDDECQDALYRLCSDGVYLGGACLDTSPPTIVSCYPDTRPDE